MPLGHAAKRTQTRLHPGLIGHKQIRWAGESERYWCTLAATAKSLRTSNLARMTQYWSKSWRRVARKLMHKLNCHKLHKLHKLLAKDYYYTSWCDILQSNLHRVLASTRASLACPWCQQTSCLVQDSSGWIGCHADLDLRPERQPENHWLISTEHMCHYYVDQCWFLVSIWDLLAFSFSFSLLL